jgi:hypothetical protein
MKELDLGNSDFKSLIENNNYFVDKTLLIKEVIKAQKQVILIPRPRRFGKTLNLSMLKYYFDINQSGSKNLFSELNVWQSGEEIREKYAKYPVIFLSFKDAKDNTWENTYKYIISEIIQLYLKHDYLLESDVLKESERNSFNDIISKKADSVDYANSLKRLSEYLFRFYKQKVVILIDEYDTPIQSGYKKYYENVISFMRNLLSGAYKDNIWLYRGVITGILRVSRESIFSGLNNVSVYSVLDDEFSDKFGFTEYESKQILNDFKVPVPYHSVKKWYDGYKIGEKENIYNPWSILNYVVAHKKGFRPYWINTSSDDLLKEQIRGKSEINTREQLQDLINDKPIEKFINENFVFPDLARKQDLIWTLLLFSGYLTVDTKLSFNRYLLKIPNYEIKTVFQNVILDWLEAEVKMQQNLLIETSKYLVNNQIDRFEKGFKKIIGDTFSYFDTHKEPENVYQSYVLGLLAIIGDDYLIKSNRESGDGRYDICLIPHDKSKFGVVIEIKQMGRDEKDDRDAFHKKINDKLLEAQNQIDKNKYYMELVDHQVSKIIKLPIVFVGKIPYITPVKNIN